MQDMVIFDESEGNLERSLQVLKVGELEETLVRTFLWEQWSGEF